MFKNTWLKPVLLWACGTVAVTGVFGGVYVAVQQNYRQSLNDPQIQIAEDAAAALSQGASMQSVISLPTIDIGQSLAPYITVFDAQGKPLASSGFLSGALPQPPPSAIQNGWHRSGAHSFFTWQPRSDVRSAVVVAPYASPQGSGYVMAGRNMREIENRISELGVDMLVAWLFTLGCLLAASFAGWWLLKTR